MLRAKLAARKLNCELIMGLVTRSPEKVGLGRGTVALCAEQVKLANCRILRKIMHVMVRQCDAHYAHQLS